MKFYQNYHFFNFKQSEQWVLRLLRKRSDGNLEFLSIDLSDDAVRKNLIARLGKKLAIREIKTNEDIYYQIRPTVERLLALIDDGFFTPVILKEEKIKRVA